MLAKKEIDIKQTVEMLKRLDAESLLLADNSIKTLWSRERICNETRQQKSNTVADKKAG